MSSVSEATINNCIEYSRMCNLQRISSKFSSGLWFCLSASHLNGHRIGPPELNLRKRSLTPPPPAFAGKIQALTFSPDGRDHVASPLLLEQCHGNVAKLVALFLPKSTTAVTGTIRLWQGKAC
jgi:hypothetical protein